MEPSQREKHVRELEPRETYLSRQTWREVVGRSKLFKEDWPQRHPGSSHLGTWPPASWAPGPQPPSCLASG